MHLLLDAQNVQKQQLPPPTSLIFPNRESDANLAAPATNLLVLFVLVFAPDNGMLGSQSRKGDSHCVWIFKHKCHPVQILELLAKLHFHQPDQNPLGSNVPVTTLSTRATATRTARTKLLVVRVVVAAEISHPILGGLGSLFDAARFMFFTNSVITPRNAGSLNLAMASSALICVGPPHHDFRRAQLMVRVLPLSGHRMMILYRSLAVRYFCMHIPIDSLAGETYVGNLFQHLKEHALSNLLVFVR